VLPPIKPVSTLVFCIQLQQGHQLYLLPHIKLHFPMAKVLRGGEELERNLCLIPTIWV
jgi:hypothetical protein